MSEKLLLRPAELAAALGINLETLKRWRRDGLVPEPIHLPRGRGIAWAVDEIKAWVAAGMPPPAKQEVPSS